MIDLQKPQHIDDFRKKLLNWFQDHQRPLPWRTQYLPYQVWISEIMGQQTQMERVSVYFINWMKQFPDLTSVAQAEEQALLKAWEGLGYYNRARNIQRAAQQLLTAGYTDIPADYDTLLALPGIGPYTAAAILSIAFNKPYPLLDANVERLFARLIDLDSPVKEQPGKKRLHNLAHSLLEPTEPRAFNQALMELGALVCTPKNPACSDCPVQNYCQAYRLDTIDFRPMPTAKKKRIDISMACSIILQDHTFFIQQRLPDDIWANLWEFPGGRLKEGETPLQGAIRELEEETGWQLADGQPFATVVHHYTRYRVTLHAFLFKLCEKLPEPVLTAASQHAWVSVSELQNYPFPAGHRKLVSTLSQSIFPDFR